MATPVGQPVECQIDLTFSALLGEIGGSVLISTYQANRVVAVSSDGRHVSLLMREFDKPMGMAASGSTLAIGTRQDILLLENAAHLAPSFEAGRPGKYDAIFIPRVSYHTGDIAAHDLAFDPSGQLFFANTRFSCISRMNLKYSFEPVWTPSFVSQTAPEDRCHLNGLGMRDGRAAYVTCLGQTDTPDGWREGKATGGCVINIATNERILDGLAMPHSPRWYDGRLWVLNSGAGELLSVDAKTGRPTVVTTLPAYLRGLDFAGHYAMVGMSMIRETHSFGGLPVQSRFRSLLCGIAAIDLRTGETVGMLRFTAGCTELFEVRFLLGIRRPMLLNRELEESRHAFTAPNFSYWIRPED